MKRCHPEARRAEGVVLSDEVAKDLSRFKLKRPEESIHVLPAPRVAIRDLDKIGTTFFEDIKPLKFSRPVSA